MGNEAKMERLIDSCDRFEDLINAGMADLPTLIAAKPTNVHSVMRYTNVLKWRPTSVEIYGQAAHPIASNK